MFNLLELACQQLDLALASKQNPTIGGVSFSKYSTALKTLSELEEELKDKEKAVQTLRELVAYLLISVPDAVDNDVVRIAMENQDRTEEERDDLVQNEM